LTKGEVLSSFMGRGKNGQRLGRKQSKGKRRTSTFGAKGKNFRCGLRREGVFGGEKRGKGEFKKRGTCCNCRGDNKEKEYHPSEGGLQGRVLGQGGGGKEVEFSLAPEERGTSFCVQSSQLQSWKEFLAKGRERGTVALGEEKGAFSGGWIEKRTLVIASDIGGSQGGKCCFSPREKKGPCIRSFGGEKTTTEEGLNDSQKKKRKKRGKGGEQHAFLEEQGEEKCHMRLRAAGRCFRLQLKKKKTDTASPNQRGKKTPGQPHKHADTSIRDPHYLGGEGRKKWGISIILSERKGRKLFRRHQ